MMYNEIKNSPLGKWNASPEEIAVWFDLYEMNNAKSIKKLMNSVERNYHTKLDWSGIRSTSAGNALFSALFQRAFEERPSSVILRNIFTFMFKTTTLKEKDVDQLIEFSKNKADTLKRKREKMLNHCRNCSVSNIMDNGAMSRLEDLFEVYSEMNERLCNRYRQRLYVAQ